MRRVFLVLACLIFVNSLLLAQEFDKKEKSTQSYELTLSLNRTTVADKNTQNRFGFGVGLYSVFFSQKRCNLIIGFEYSRNVQFKKHMSGGRSHFHSSSHSDVTYIINSVGTPICFRVNMGQKVKFFIDAGAFVDFFNAGRQTGTRKMFGYNPTDSTHYNTVSQFDDKGFLYKTNFGILGGVGLRIPVKKHEILLKGDYKWGIRNTIDDYYGEVYNRFWRFTIGFKASF